MPTPARRATSSIGACRPCSLNTSRAASMMRSRFSAASRRRCRSLVSLRVAWRAFGPAGSGIRERLSNEREDLRAEQLDPPQDLALRHAADVHLEDLARVAEEPVQVQDPLSDLLGAADEDHAAALVRRRA